MRNLNSNLLNESSKSYNRPVELYEIYLDEATLYFTTYNQVITFMGHEWIPLGLSRTPIRTVVESQVDECTVTMDNVTRELSAMIAHTEFSGRRMVIRKVFLDLLDNDAHSVVIFDGLMDAPVVNESAMRVTVRSQMDKLEVQIPRRTYRRLCNWKFGSPECGIDLEAVTVKGIITGINDNVLTLTGRNEAQDYFVDGVLTVGNEKRLVIASNGSQVTVEYPFDQASIGDGYSLRRGCNKTFDQSCVGRFDNGANFGGFLSVPTKERSSL